MAVVGFVMLVVLPVLVLLPILAAIDAALQPDSAWRAADQSKLLWVAVAFFGSFIGAAAYLVVVRPRVRRAARLAPA